MKGTSTYTYIGRVHQYIYNQLQLVYNEQALAEYCHSSCLSLSSIVLLTFSGEDCVDRSMQEQ